MGNIARTWIDQGKAKVLPLRISTEFSDHIDSLPWVGSSLEWSRLQPFTTINISEAPAEELLKWVRFTALGACTHMALCFSPKEPCLLVSLEDGIRHIDELFWGSGGICFCFGVDIEHGEPQPKFGALLQYGAGDLLFAKARAS